MKIRDLKDCISIDEDMILEYVQQNYEPDQVFETQTLIDWALRNGFIEKKD